MLVGIMVLIVMIAGQKEAGAGYTYLESYLANDNVDLSAPVLIKKIPEVTVCTMEQRIESYDTLHESYAALLNYIEENSYEICGNIRESYIDGVWNKEMEREWLTEIQVPVRRI